MTLGWLALACLAETFSGPNWGQVTFTGDANARQVVLAVTDGDTRAADWLEDPERLVVRVRAATVIAALAKSPSCAYPAARLEELSHYVQMKLGFTRYLQPALLGVGSGTALVLAALAQGPPNTFAGVVTVDFCPNLAPPKALCKGRSLRMEGGKLRAPEHITEPWIALQGAKAACSLESTKAYALKVPTADVQELPAEPAKASIEAAPSAGQGAGASGAEGGKGPGAAGSPGGASALAGQGGASGTEGGKGAGTSGSPGAPPEGGVQRQLLLAALRRLQPLGEPPPMPASPEVHDLPVVEVPVTAGDSPYGAIIVSGDGGWASIDREIAETFATQGIPVAGLSSLQYFWKARDPNSAAGDLQRLIEHYRTTWHKSHMLVVGFSLGADVLPFMLSRLPPATQEMVKYVALLGPSAEASFEFHLTDWIGGDAASDALPVLPEMQKLDCKHLMCIYASQDGESPCPALACANRVKIPGGHHFGGDYPALAHKILDAVAAQDASP